MNQLFASGHVVDIVLAVMVVELVWLVAGEKWSTPDALLRLAPGALMLVALRASLTGIGWEWIARPLLASFPLRLADLARSKRRPGDMAAGSLLNNHRADQLLVLR